MTGGQLSRDGFVELVYAGGLTAGAFESSVTYPLRGLTEPGSKMQKALPAGGFGRRNVPRIGSLTIAVGSGLLMLTVVGLAGSAGAWSTSSWGSTWHTLNHDWAPCIGHDNYYLDTSAGGLAAGVYNGYSDNLASADLLCSPDTTEHDDSGGQWGTPNFSPSTTGSYTLKATYSGTVWVWASQGTCNAGTGHAFFEIGVNAYDTNTKVSTYQWVTPHGLSVSQSCGASGNQVAVGSVSLSMTFYSSDTYQLAGGIDEQSGASENWNGNSAEGFVGFENVCWGTEGGGTSSTVTLTSISVT